MKRLLGLGIPLFVGILVVGLCAPVFAQSVTTGILEGQVRDGDGNNLADAIVTVTGPQGIRTQVTGANGKFSFYDLVPADSYTVKAEAAGYATVVQTDVQITLGKRTQIPFALPKGVTEQVTVTSEAPIVDMRSTSVGATITVNDFVEYIPLGRNFSQMFTLAPGVVSGLASGAGNYSISGSSGLENSYLIDGVNITNSGYGGIGAYNRVFGSLGSGVTNDFIDQVEVKSGGFEAEFGQATGGVVNAIVKSGTNQMSGGITLYGSPGAMQAQRRYRELIPEAVSLSESTRLDLGLSLGGPIVKDKLFWYAAYNPVQVDTDLVLIRPTVSTTESQRTETRTRTNQNWAAKFSWFVTPNHRVELTGFGDPSTGDFGPQRSSALQRDGEQAYSELDYGGNNYSVKYFGALTSNFFIDFLYANHLSELTEKGADLYRIDQIDVNVPGVLPTGGIGFSPQTDEDVKQLAFKLTWVIGNHEIKAGYQQDDIEYFEAGAQTGPIYNSRLPTATIDANGEPVWTGEYFAFPSTTGAYMVQTNLPPSPTGSQFAIQRSRFSPVAVVTENTEKNFFLQWTGSFGPAWTVKVGARYTDEKVAGGSPFTLPFEVVRQSASAGGSRSRMIDLNSPQAYEPTTVQFPKEWAPRVGVTWDVGAQGKYKLYANYAQYIQRMTQDLAYRQFSNEIDIRQNWADSAITTPLENGSCPVSDGNGGYVNQQCQAITAATGLGGPSTVFDGTKLPVTNEGLIGFSWQLNPTSGIDIRYTARELERIIEDFSYVPQESINNALWGTGFGVFPFDPYPTLPSEFFGDYVLANIGQNTQAALEESAPDSLKQLYADGTLKDFDNPVRDYQALEFTYNKRFSNNWLAWIAYRYAELDGNYEGLLRNDNGQDDPNITSLYDFPDTPLMAGQFLVGPLNTNVRHNLKVYGTYQWDMGLNLGGGFGMSTGTPRFPMLVHPNDFYQLPGNGEVPGDSAVYAQWFQRNSDDETILVLRQGIGGVPNEFADGTLDSNGELVFQDYTPDPLDQPLGNPVSGLSQFLYDYRPVKRGSTGETPTLINVDLHISYDLKVNFLDSRIQFALDAFNIFDDQVGRTWDDVSELNQAEANPNEGRPLSFQGPRTIRLGVRWTF